MDLLKKEKIIIPQEIKELIQKREKARKNKKWEQADQIRKQIKQKGYQVEDTEQGQKVSPKY